jgi:hypothetical protein
VKLILYIAMLNHYQAPKITTGAAAVEPCMLEDLVVNLNYKDTLC